MPISNQHFRVQCDFTYPRPKTPEQAYGRTRRGSAIHEPNTQAQFMITHTNITAFSQSMLPISVRMPNMNPPPSNHHRTKSTNSPNKVKRRSFFKQIFNDKTQPQPPPRQRHHISLFYINNALPTYTSPSPAAINGCRSD